MITDRARVMAWVTAGLAALLMSAGAGPSSAAPLVPLPAQRPDVPWPTKQWPGGVLPAGVPAATLERLLAVVAAPRPRLGQTRAVLIVHGGRLVAERYMPGFGPDTPLISWSVAKSITHALVGIAVRDGRVDIDRPLGNPRWTAADPRAAVTWRQWINMVDGQAFHEIGVASPTRNDSARMLFGHGRLDVAGYASALPLARAPGAAWNYNSAAVTLVADALGRLYAPGAAPAERRARLHAVMRRELFDPLGMTSVAAQFDAQGTFIGSALVYATARDYARFGLLYLRDGVWDGRRVLAPGWVDFARTSTDARNGWRYGAGWWVEPAPGADGAGSWPVGGPPDSFRAQGFQGQVITVVPSKDLVVVRLGLLEDEGAWPALLAWLREVIATFPSI
jgi:CubicO group peptidase (beta-lactamase class C family)